MGEPVPVKRLFVAVLVVVVVVATAVFAGASEADGSEDAHVLAFRALLLEVPSPAATSGAISADVAAAVSTCNPGALAALAVSEGQPIPVTTRDGDDPASCVVLEQRFESARLFLGPSELNGEAVRTAKAEFQAGQGWSVSIRFTKRGAAQFDALSEAHFQERVAIVLDGVVQSAPMIQPGDTTFASFGGVAVISGDYSKREAKRIARAIEHSR